MPTDRKRARVNQEQPVAMPSDAPTPAEPTKKKFKMPPGAVDVTWREHGRAYAMLAAPPPGSRLTRS
jgi:hypothetical protein